MDKNIDAAVDQITNELINTPVVDAAIQSEVIDPSSKKLLVAAKKYIDSISEVENELTNFKNLLIQMKNIRKMYDDNEYKKLESYQNLQIKKAAFLVSNIPKKIYNDTEEFQIILNEVLNQTVSLIFVAEDEKKEPILWKIDKMNKVLTYDVSSDENLTARFRNLNMQKLSDIADRIITENENTLEKIKNLKPVYIEVVKRFTEHKKLVMWYPIPQNTWYKIKISAKGDIAEAYAAEVFTPLSTFNYNDEIEDNNIDVFMTAVLKVDNISGMLQGDISSNNIEYAIKSLGASGLGLTQFKKIAEQIVADNGSFDKTKLLQEKQRLADLGKTRNHIYKLIDKKTDEWILEVRS